MSSLDQVVKSLDLASDHMWKITLDKPAFDTLKTKCSWLSAQVAVHHALQNTVTHLLGPDGSIPVPQGHLTKFINAAYGSLEDVNHQNRSRLGQIRKLGCVPFLLIASTYTPLDIFKMNRTEFDYLMENVDKYLNFNYPSWRWIFRKEIQMALAAMSGLEHVAPLRKRYHELEFDAEAADDERPTKRTHLEDLLSEKNYANIKSPNSDHRIETMVDSQIPEPLPDGIGTKQESPSSVILTKDARRRGSNHPHLQVEGPLKQVLTARSSISAVKALHSASTPLQQGNQESSKSFATTHAYILPLTEAGAQVILASVREGVGHELNIILPAPHGQPPQPFMLIPLQICANIMGKYTR